MNLVKPTDSPIGVDPHERADIAAVHRAQRNAAVVTAVHVARDWAIEAQGARYGVSRAVERYMALWLIRNGVDRENLRSIDIADLVEAVWALAELPDADPLQLVDDTWRGTSDEARSMLQAQYERDLVDALNRITWKD